MADMLQKRAVVVIDHRTSMVCLHVAGQVKPIDEPYVTLLGEFQSPPFHGHCRTQSVPEMAGFPDTQRGAANAEIMRRPVKERQRLAGRLRDRPAQVDVQPIAPTRPSLPGGQTKIDDVPPERLREWMLAHPERFQMTSNGGGISETYWAKDAATGDRWVVKKGQYNHESVNEIAGTRLAAEIGLPGRARIAGDMADGNGWLLLDHAEDVLPGHKVVGTGGGHSQIPKLLDRLADEKDPVRTLLSHFVLDEADAKGGNMLLLSADAGKTVRLVPIDRSLSLMGWRGAVEPGKSAIVVGDWSLAGRLKVADLRAYMKTRGSPKGVLELVQRQAERPGGARMVRQTYDEVLTALRKIDVDAMFDGLDSLHAEEAKRLIRRRIEVLTEQRDLILKQMGAAG